MRRVTEALLVRDGDAVPVAITGARLTDHEGVPRGGVAVIRDMTREREIDRMKSQFLSNISHELRTPLTPIKGYAQILGGPGIPPEAVQRSAQGITDAAARLERIVELLVDFAALEAGRLSTTPTDVDLGALLAEIVDGYRGRTTRHEIELSVEPGLPAVVGDERLLRRSFEEVLDNAVKFSPDGGTIRVEGRRVPGAADGRVEIAVADQGIGIAPEDLADIFSDFRQLDGSATRAYGGLGLGLAFVNRIVEAHDGRIEVDSRPGAGTRLAITLPCGPAPPPVR